MAITDDPRVKEFQLRIKAQVKEHVDYMAQGKCQTYDDYKRRVGLITGLELSLETLTEVLKTFDPDRDDDDD